MHTGGLLVNSTENQLLLQTKDTCDKYDYLIAVACGAVGGLVDAFFVGVPNKTALGKWTDEQVDSMVKKFAKLSGWTAKSLQDFLNDREKYYGKINLNKISNFRYSNIAENIIRQLVKETIGKIINML